MEGAPNSVRRVQASEVEAEFFHLGFEEPGLGGVGAGGVRVVEAEFLHDADVDTLAAVRTAIVISLVFDNGGTTTAERELNIQLNGAFLEGRPETGGAWGVKKTTLKWMNRLAAAPYAVTIKNGDGTIP